MASSFEFDHAYLRETVAAPLTEGMAQLAILQPEDPVEFLGNFLLKNVETELHRQEVARSKHQQSRPATSTIAPGVYSIGGGGDHNNAISTAEAAQLEHLLQHEQALPDKLAGVASMPQLCGVFAEWLAAALNAEEAYVGRRVVDPANAGSSLVHWVASSRGPTAVTVDKFLAEANDTITFDVFKEVAAAGPEGDAAPPVDADGNPLPPAVPKFIHVENVLREPRLKFFHIPKLGAYLTRGLQFKSFLHADVFNDSNIEEPVIKDEWLVVAADTMGQARAFSALETDAFARATSVFIHTLETLERKLYMADVERKTANGEDEQLKEFGIAFAAQVAVHEENLMLQVQSLPEDEKSLKEAELRAAFMTFLLVSHAPTLAIASERVVPFKRPALVVFATVLTLLGHAKAELTNAATKLPSWDKLAPLISEPKLKPRLEVFVLPSGNVVSLAKQQLGDVSKADAEAVSPIAGCLFAWAQSVFAHADQVEAKAERERIATEEAADAAAAGSEG